MDILQAIILGIVQGLTEFIPLSSTAHLVFASRLTNVYKGNPAQITATMAVFQLGTLAAVFVYFPGDIWGTAPEPANDEQKTLYAIGVAISQSLTPFTLNESELEFVKSGPADGVLKRSQKVDLNVYGPKIQQMQQVRANAVADVEKKGTTFLTKAAAEPGPHKTE